MIPVLVSRVKTQDGVPLEGIIVHPKRASSTALIWLHGLGSRFSSGQTLVAELGAIAAKHNFGYFKFNTRGHEIAARGNIRTEGSGFERFEDCILDIRAMIRLAKSLGYKNIVLAGHSTGANKALYYCHKTQDKSVKGLMLLGPISDVAAKAKEMGADNLKRAIKTAETLIKKNPEALMPIEHGLMSASRFLSLYRAGSSEDVFPYHNPAASWKELQSIRIPTAVIIGTLDQYRDRPVHEIMQAFIDHAPLTKSLTGITIKGANHSFQRQEKGLADGIAKWIKEEI